MNVHIEVEKGTDRRELMTTLIDMLRKEFGIDHTTI